MNSYPQDIADKLSEIISRKDLVAYGEKAAKSAKAESWEKAYIQVEKIVIGELRG